MLTFITTLIRLVGVIFKTCVGNVAALVWQMIRVLVGVPSAVSEIKELRDYVD